MTVRPPVVPAGVLLEAQMTLDPIDPEFDAVDTRFPLPKVLGVSAPRNPLARLELPWVRAAGTE